MLTSRKWKQESYPPTETRQYYHISNMVMPLLSVSSEDQRQVFTDFDWVLPEQEISRVLVEMFKQIPEVKSICARFSANEITIWTLLESYDREAREKIYSKELEICKYLSFFDFDFRVTSIDLVSPDELINAGSCEIYRRP